MKRLFQTDSGFTLVELLVVVLVLSILVAIAVPSFTSQVEDSKAQKARTNITIAAREAAVYAVSHNDNLSAFTTTAATVAYTPNNQVIIISDDGRNGNSCSEAFTVGSGLGTSWSAAGC